MSDTSSSSYTSSMRGENIIGLPMGDWESTEVKGPASSPTSFTETLDDTRQRRMRDSCGLAANGDINDNEMKAKGMNAKAKVWKKKDGAIRTAVAKRKSDPASSTAPSTPPPKFKTARYATSSAPQTPDKQLVAVTPVSLLDLATQLNKTINPENVQRAAQLFTAADLGPQPTNLLICAVCATQKAAPSIKYVLPFVCTDCSAKNTNVDTTCIFSCDGNMEGQATFSRDGNLENTTFSCDGNVDNPVDLSSDHWRIGSQHDVNDNDNEQDGVIRARLMDKGLIFPPPSVRAFRNALPGMYDSPYRFRRSPSPELVRARPSSAPASLLHFESHGHDSHCSLGDRSADLGNDQLICVRGPESPVVVCSAQPRTDQPFSVPALFPTAPTDEASCAIIHPCTGVHTSQAGQSSCLSSEPGCAPSPFGVKLASPRPSVVQDATFSPLQRPAGQLGDALPLASPCAAPSMHCTGTDVQAASLSDSALVVPTSLPSAESLALEVTLSSDDAAIVNTFLARSSTSSFSNQLQRGDAIEGLPAAGFTNSEAMHMVRIRDFVKFPQHIETANTYVPLNALLHAPLMQPRVTASISPSTPEQDAHHEDIPNDPPAVHPKVQDLLAYHNQIQSNAYGIKEPSMDERYFDLQRELNAQARQFHMAVSANRALKANQDELLDHLKLANENIMLKDHVIQRLQERVEELENELAA